MFFNFWVGRHIGADFGGHIVFLFDFLKKLNPSLSFPPPLVLASGVSVFQERGHCLPPQTAQLFTTPLGTRVSGGGPQMAAGGRMQSSGLCSASEPQFFPDRSFLSMCRQAGPNTDKVLRGILDPPCASYSEHGGNCANTNKYSKRKYTVFSSYRSESCVCVCIHVSFCVCGMCVGARTRVCTC